MESGNSSHTIDLQTWQCFVNTNAQVHQNIMTWSEGSSTIKRSHKYQTAVAICPDTISLSFLTIVACGIVKRDLMYMMSSIGFCWVFYPDGHDTQATSHSRWLMTHMMTLANKSKFQGQLHRQAYGGGPAKDNKVTKMTTNDPKWQCGKSCKTTDVTTTDDTWWPKWWPKYNPDDPDNNGWLPWMINVTTHWRPKKFSWRHLTTPSGDIYRQSWKLPVLQVLNIIEQS